MGNNKRLLALDILRGITIAGMLMVNNPGSWSYMYGPLKHASWHGLTPTDLIFPFFMFIMGISTYISLRKFNFEPSRDTILKIIKRTCIIFAIGLGVAWLSLSFRTYNGLGKMQLDFFDRLIQSISNFENLRILGVMPRLALTYGAASLIAVFVKHKYIPWLIAVTLLGYMVLLLVGNGLEHSETNIVSIIDQAILGAKHMYHDGGIALDPEGLISTLPAIAHVLIGFMCGQALLSTKDNNERIINLFVVGIAMMFAGFLLDYACPINKKLWTPSFVLATCGLGACFLGLLIWIIDIKGYKKWSVFFESFGVNPLFIYVLGTVISILSTSILIPYGGKMIGVKTLIYNEGLQPLFGDYLGSFIYSLAFIGVLWIIGNQLYKKQIYIKI